MQKFIAMRYGKKKSFKRRSKKFKKGRGGKSIRTVTMSRGGGRL